MAHSITIPMQWEPVYPSRQQREVDLLAWRLGDFSRPGTGIGTVFQRSRHLGCAHSLIFAVLLRSTTAKAVVMLS